MMNERALNYLNVFMGTEGISELHGGSRIFIPRQEIRKIELVHGYASERPRLQFIVGVAMLGAAIYMIAGIASFFAGDSGGPVMGKAILMPLFPGVLGIWMLLTALRKRTYLSVSTGKNARKIIFHGAVEVIALQDFLEEASRRYGYAVTSTIPGVGGA